MSFDFSRVSETWPENWSFKKLSEVADVNLKTISKKEQPEYIYYIDISSVSTGYCEYPKKLKFSEAPSRARRIIKNNDIIISTVRPNLKQHVLLENVDKNWIASTGFCVVSPKDANTAWYIYSILTSDVFNEHLVRVADGGAYPAFNPKEIEDALIPWPDENNLLQVNKFIKSIFNKIELNNQISQTLEAIAQSIFKSWFVDFEPVKAKVAVLQAGGSHADGELAAMMAISGKTAEQLSTMRTTQLEAFQQLTQTAALFPAAMQESELGEIPERWKVKGLDSIANYLNGLALQKFRPKDGEASLPVLKIAQLKAGVADREESASADIKPEYVVDNGDVIFSWSGSLVVDIWCGGKVALNQHLFKVTSTEYPKWFFYYCTKHHLNEFQRIAAAKAVTMGHIKREHLTSALCAVDEKAIEAVNKALSDLLEQQITLRIQNRQLSDLRDNLLPKLLSGEIDLSAIEEVAA